MIFVKKYNKIRDKPHNDLLCNNRTVKTLEKNIYCDGTLDYDLKLKFSKNLDNLVNIHFYICKMQSVFYFFIQTLTNICSSIIEYILIQDNLCL